MKKFRVALVTALVLLASVLCLVACGGTGTYKLDSIQVGTQTIEAGEDYEGHKLEKETVTLKLNSDGTCTYKAYGSDAEVEGTWEEKDDKITVTVGGVPTTFTKDGKKLVLDMFVMKITLKK